MGDGREGGRVSMRVRGERLNEMKGRVVVKQFINASKICFKKLLHKYMSGMGQRK